MVTKGKTQHSSYEVTGCPVEATLELIGGKWKGIILFYLLEGRLRNSVLKRRIGCVPPLGFKTESLSLFDKMVEDSK